MHVAAGDPPAATCTSKRAGAWGRQRHQERRNGQNVPVPFGERGFVPTCAGAYELLQRASQQISRSSGLWGTAAPTGELPESRARTRTERSSLSTLTSL